MKATTGSTSVAGFFMAEGRSFISESTNCAKRFEGAFSRFEGAFSRFEGAFSRFEGAFSLFDGAFSRCDSPPSADKSDGGALEVTPAVDKSGEETAGALPGFVTWDSIRMRSPALSIATRG